LEETGVQKKNGAGALIFHKLIENRLNDGLVSDVVEFNKIFICLKTPDEASTKTGFEIPVVPGLMLRDHLYMEILTDHIRSRGKRALLGYFYFR
jgi:hypothetical protein